MYEQFFGLSEKPFSIQPDPSFLYWGRTHRLAYAMLEYGVLNHAGISVITGEVGCGKTTLVHRLLDQLSDTHTVALLSNIQEGRGDLLSWVLMGFGEPFANKTHVELFSQLQSFFIGEYAKGKRVVMIIDEAQNLSADMLEELRMLSNINAGKDQLLQLILVGQPQLKDLLNKPELLQLAQRVGSDFHLTPLSNEEVHAYIETRLAIAGCQHRVFSDRAIDLISEQSKGVPRVINIIADTALVYAFSAEDLVVGVDTIRNVIRDKSEFGVFGLAADEHAAAPIKSVDETGIDAFAKPSAAPKDNPRPNQKSNTNGPDRAVRSKPKEDLPSQPPKPDSPKVKASAEPIEAEINAAELKASPSESNASGSLVAVASERKVEKEESSITGVIIIADGKVSPEAAIRSAGDGRAIVFVANEDSPDAIVSARKAGAVVVETPGDALHTAGRARNAGYRQLKKIAPHIQFVQYLDVRHALDPDWIVTAEKFMRRRPEVSVVEGAHIQRGGTKTPAQHFDAKSQLDTDGEIRSTIGGTALIRTQSFESAGGFRGDLAVADLEDLCIRLRRRGARIWQLESNMSLGAPEEKIQRGWWRSNVEQGYKNAYCASLHGAPPERLGVPETMHAVFWGMVFPFVLIALAILSMFFAERFAPSTPGWVSTMVIISFGVIVYFLRTLMMAAKSRIFRLRSWQRAIAQVFGATPEFFGACRHWFFGKQ